jgi:hypothetical protein
MLFEIVVNIPSLLMREIAWCVCVATDLACLLAPFTSRGRDDSASLEVR